MIACLSYTLPSRPPQKVRLSPSEETQLITVTAAEFKVLQFTPLWIFLLVAQADGMITEQKLDTLTHKILNPANFKSALVKAVLPTLEDEEIYQQFTADARSSWAGIKEAVTLLRNKLDAQEVQSFQAELLKMAYFAAQASTPWYQLMYSPKVKEVLTQFRALFA